MFCKSCGNQVADNERFCPYCGAALATGPAQPHPNQPQYPPQQQYRGPVAAAPTDKKKLFGLIVSIAFGAAALFALLGMIGFCTKLTAHAGMIISTVFVIISCGGIAIAPFLKDYTKLCITASGALLFLGTYGISMLQIAGSFGFFIYMLGFAALAALCWLSYTKNDLADKLWFVPAAVIFLGALLNWIIVKYFTMMKWAFMYYFFDLFTAIAIIAGAVLLGLYLKEIKNDKAYKFNVPNPGARAPQQPPRPQQPPYQGR